MLVSKVQGFLWLNNQPLRDHLPVEEAEDGCGIMGEASATIEITLPLSGVTMRVA